MAATVQNQRLYVKSYYAGSVQEAIDAARQEMGRDALLLNTREAPPEARHLGAYEVVFGESAEPVETPPPASSDGVAQLRRQIEELRELMLRASFRSAQPDDWMLEEALLGVGIDADLAGEISGSVRQRIASRQVVQMRQRRPAAPDAELVMQEAAAEIDARFEVAPRIGRVTALVGPPGAGKTSTLVKLALQHLRTTGGPVHVLSIDNYRIAAVQQIQTFAAILGVPFQACETTAALERAIDAAPEKATLCIDTPGYCRAALEESGSDLARLLERRQDIDTHLVLTASMRSADLRRTIERFEAFRPNKLLFTRLDETDSFASMFCAAAVSGKPLSFFGAGQLIPEDLEPASKQAVTAALVRELPNQVRAVA